MTDNKFFFRDEYTIEEMEDRIRAEDFILDNSPVYEIIDKVPLNPDKVDKMGKEEFLNTLGSKLDSSDYNDFISEMFKRYGHEGDRFNQQLFRLPPERDLDGLVNSLSRFEGGALTKPFDFVLTQPLHLKEVKTEGSKIDLRFNTSFKMEEYESDEEIPIKVFDKDDELVEKIPEDRVVKVPTKRRVEARIYPDMRLLSVSNSEIPDRLQKEIFSVVVAIIADSPEIGEPEGVNNE